MFSEDKITTPEELTISESETERHSQTMEAALESMESVFFGTAVSPKMGWQEIADQIASEMESKGLAPNEEQRRWIKERAQKWTKDVSEEIEGMKQLYLDGALHSLEFNSPEWERATQGREKLFDGKEPWRLIESDPLIQRGFLEYLPVEDKNPDNFLFFADKPPFIIVCCKKYGDYDSITGGKNKGRFSSGMASRDFFFDTRHGGLEPFKGKVALLCEAGEEIKIHERQHLFYGHYVADKKTQDWQAIDELTAYLRTGRYEDLECRIFSDLTWMPEGLFFNEEWRKAKMQFYRLESHGVDPRELWAIVGNCEDLKKLAERLEKIKIEPENFKPKPYNYRAFEWFVAEGLNSSEKAFYQQRIKEAGVEQMFASCLRHRLMQMFDLAEKEGVENDTAPFWILTEHLSSLVTFMRRVRDIFPALADQKICRCESKTSNESEIPDVFAQSMIKIASKTCSRYFDFAEKFTLPEFSREPEEFTILLEKFEKIKDAIDMAYRYISLVNQLKWKNVYLNDENKDRIKTLFRAEADFDSLSIIEQTELLSKLSEHVTKLEKENNTLLSEINELLARESDNNKKKLEIDDYLDPFQINKYLKSVMETLQK